MTAFIFAISNVYIQLFMASKIAIHRGRPSPVKRHSFADGDIRCPFYIADITWQIDRYFVGQSSHEYIFLKLTWYFDLPSAIYELSTGRGYTFIKNNTGIRYF